MSKATDFLEHLTDLPQSRKELCAASGEDERTVANRLTALRMKKLAQRTADGWIRTNGTAPPTVTDESDSEPASSDSGEPKFSFFIDEDCDVQIARRDGTGDAAIIPREEALRLRDFLNQFGDVMRAS